MIDRTIEIPIEISVDYIHTPYAIGIKNISMQSGYFSKVLSLKLDKILKEALQDQDFEEIVVKSVEEEGRDNNV